MLERFESQGFDGSLDEGQSRRGRQPATPELGLAAIAVRVVVVWAVAMLAASAAIWLVIAFGQRDDGDSLNLTGLISVTLITAGVLFGLAIVPALLTVMAARFTMARSFVGSRLVVGVLMAILTLICWLVIWLSLGSASGQALQLGWVGMVIANAITIGVAPWLVRPLRGGRA